MEKPVALIPARGGSKGIPKKNLISFCGLPLVAWSIKQALSANLDTYVSTEDEDIKRCALEFGAKVIDRPKDLAEDDSSTIDVIQHAVRVLNIMKVNYNFIALFQPTSPLRRFGDIWNALLEYQCSTANYMLSCCKKKILEWDTENPEFPYGSTPRRQEIGSKVVEHGMLYIYDEAYSPIGLGKLNANNVFFNFTPEWQSYEIDEPDDVDICEYYMRKKVLCSTKV